MTVISSMIQSIRKAAAYNRHELAPPRVILWPDEERLWGEVIDLLRVNHPALWSLGDYDPVNATGPAAWLRYQLETQGGDNVPVIYLPGIGRAAFRSAEQCPNPARHLFALQFQGQFWTQKNGKDWTPFAFLSSPVGGLGLDVAGDQDTKKAIQEGLPYLMEIEVNTLKGRRLEAGDFHPFVTKDPVRTLLRWMGDPVKTRTELECSGAEWSSFCAVCRDEFGFNPEKDGAITAAEKLSSGKATVAKMFVNNANGQRGLVCQYDVVCFDEVSGISFDQKDGVNIMKGYMESGEFSRGKESIRGFGGIVMVGNFEVDVEHQQRIGHLLGPLPPEMRNDTAFMDRIHAYIPGWDVPKVSRDLLTDHFGLVSDFLSSCWNHLRTQSRVPQLQGRIQFGGALSGRDTSATQKTVSGLLKLMFPDPESEIPEEGIEWAARLALECRRRVKEQQKRIGAAEFRNTHFSFIMIPDGMEQFVSTPELHRGNSIGTDPLPPGQVWALSPGGPDENPGLFRIEVTEGPGSGVKILNQSPPGPLKESVRCAEQNLYVRSKELVGDRDPRAHEFTIQFRAFDACKSAAATGIPVLLAMSSALVERNLEGGLVIVGGLNLGGSIEPIYNAVSIVELAADKGAQKILIPVSARKQLFELPDDLATRVIVVYYADARDALLKAISE